MLVLVSKWTLLDDRGGNRGLEKLKKKLPIRVDRRKAVVGGCG